LNVLLLSQLIGMFDKFTQEFPIIAGEVLDLKLIGKESVPMFTLAEDSIQENLFDVDVFSDGERMKLMQDLVDELAKIRANTVSTLKFDGF
jgi:hypothetical protein